MFLSFSLCLFLSEFLTNFLNLRENCDANVVWWFCILSTNVLVCLAALFYVAVILHPYFEVTLRWRNINIYSQWSASFQPRTCPGRFCTGLQGCVLGSYFSSFTRYFSVWAFLGCTDAFDSARRLILQHFPRSFKLTYFSYPSYSSTLFSPYVSFTFLPCHDYSTGASMKFRISNLFCFISLHRIIPICM